jgi:hypothetical protein
MDTNKHTVTIPIADYTELLTFKDKALSGDENLKRHMGLLYDAAKVLALPDLGKTPKEAKMEYDARRDQQICRFIY